jgi:hypothetical protein
LCSWLISALLGANGISSPYSLFCSARPWPDLKRPMTIGLFLQHVLPKGFIKVHYYAFYATSKKHLWKIVKQRLGVPEKAKKAKLIKPFLCPNCGKAMIVVKELPAKRGPPLYMMMNRQRIKEIFQ